MDRPRSFVVALAALLAGCSAVPMPSMALLPQPGPVQVVGAALGAVIDHDLDAANAMVCLESRRQDGLPFDVGPIFLPLGSLGEVVPDEAITLVAITPVGVAAEPRAVDGGVGYVDVTGALALDYDLEATRAYAVRATSGSDPDLVERVLRVAGDGHLSVSVNASVSVANWNGAWMICDTVPAAGG